MDFNFRIITTQSGTKIIDRTLITPYNSLNQSEKLEYIIQERILIDADILAKAKAKKFQRSQRVKNPLYKIALLCGIV